MIDNPADETVALAEVVIVSGLRRALFNFLPLAMPSHMTTSQVHSRRSIMEIRRPLPHLCRSL